MKTIYNLLKEQKYSEAILEIKSKLQNDQNNSELWYSLFLAENEDYINTDFENIKNEISFNKALSLDNKQIYITEYNFYKAISKIGLHRLFRSAQKNYMSNIRKYSKDVVNINYIFTSEEINDICNQVEYMENTSSFRFTLDLFYVLLNVLYLKTNSNVIKKTLNVLATRCEENKTIIKPHYHDSLKFLPKKIENIAEFYWWVEQENKLIQAMDIPLCEIYLIDENWDKVTETLRYVDYVSYEYILLFLADLKIHTMEEVFEKIITTDLLKNYYFENLYNKPDLNTYNDYIQKVYSHNLKCMNYSKAINNYKNINSYNYLVTISDFFDAKKYIKMYEEENYINAINLYNSKSYIEAIKVFKLILNFKDSNKYIVQCQTKINELEQLRIKKEKRKKLLIGILVIIAIIAGIILVL